MRLFFSFIHGRTLRLETKTFSRIPRLINNILFDGTEIIGKGNTYCTYKETPYILVQYHLLYVFFSIRAESSTTRSCGLHDELNGASEFPFCAL